MTVSGFDSSHVFCFIVHCTYLFVIHLTTPGACPATVCPTTARVSTWRNAVLCQTVNCRMSWGDQDVEEVDGGCAIWDILTSSPSGVLAPRANVEDTLSVLSIAKS